jgi:hypothetical protein
MMANTEAIEQELLKILQFGGLNKDNLASLVKIVASFTDKGLNQFKVFPKGIPPVYESLEIRSVVDATKLNSLLGTILSEAQVSSVLIFPYGIPAYDAAEVVVGLGPAPVTGTAGAAEAGA